MALFRQPLLQREVTIIRNMKRKLKLLVTKIAIAVGRTKKTVYKALDPTWKLIKRGRQDALTPGDLTFLLRRLKALALPFEVARTPWTRALPQSKGLRHHRRDAKIRSKQQHL